MKQLNTTNLSFLGTMEEYQITKAVIEDEGMYSELQPLLNPVDFTDPGIQEVVNVIKSFSDEKHYCPTYRDIELLLMNNIKDHADRGLALRALNKLQTDKGLENGMETAKEIGIKAIKSFEARRILTNMSKALKDGYSIEKINRYIEQFQGIEKSSRASFLIPGECVDRVFARENTCRVTTGIKEFDKQFNGGLPKKAIGLIVAGTGVGKTTLSSIMASRAAVKGAKVIHIFFEDTEEEVTEKYYCSTWSGHYTNDLRDSNEGVKDELYQYWDEHPEIRKGLTENLIQIKLEPGRVTVDEMITHIRRVCSIRNFIPDAIYIDYLSCIKKTNHYNNPSGNQEYVLFEDLMRSLAAYADELNVAMWILQQNNSSGEKSSSKDDYITNIQGGYRITQPSNIYLYVDKDRNSDDFNSISIKTLKCRGCKPMNWDDVTMNNGSCQIYFESGNIFTEPVENTDY